MQLFDSEILAEGQGLTLLFSLIVMGIGLALWLLGWRFHRFWLVMSAAAMGGLIGLRLGPEYGMQPLVAAFLTGLAAGVMAVTLMRVLAFAAGGVAGYVLLHSLAPSWNHGLVGILAGGLLGVILFRVWIMALTSFAGALLLGYGTLWLLDRPGEFESARWAADHTPLLNAGALTATVLGVVGQLFLERLRAKWLKDRKLREEEQTRVAEEEAKRQARKKGLMRFIRKAG